LEVLEDVENGECRNHNAPHRSSKLIRVRKSARGKAMMENGVSV